MNDFKGLSTLSLPHTSCSSVITCGFSPVSCLFYLVYATNDEACFCPKFSYELSQQSYLGWRKFPCGYRISLSTNVFREYLGWYCDDLIELNFLLRKWNRQEYLLFFIIGVTSTLRKCPTGSKKSNIEETGSVTQMTRFKSLVFLPLGTVNVKLRRDNACIEVDGGRFEWLW